MVSPNGLYISSGSASIMTILVNGNAKPQVLVKWHDRPLEDTTWEFAAELRDEFFQFHLKTRWFFKRSGMLHQDWWFKSKTLQV